MTLSIITTVTRPDIYHKAIGKNPFLSCCRLTRYDNSQKNLPIPVRYNQFIETEMTDQDDWLIFCHQDFEFLQQPEEIIHNLDKNCIYGPIGVRCTRLPNYSLICRPNRRPSLRKKIHRHSIFLGQIEHGVSLEREVIGTKIATPQSVDTLDCCCLFVHSSLVRSAGLRFDETFDFHLYAEDFCLSARKKNIPVKAVQCECHHYSKGTLDQMFWDRYDQLLKKYPDEFFLTTCVSNPKQVFLYKLKNTLSKPWVDLLTEEFFSIN